jgi:hypothetical protein
MDGGLARNSDRGSAAHRRTHAEPPLSLVLSRFAPSRPLPGRPWAVGSGWLRASIVCLVLVATVAGRAESIGAQGSGVTTPVAELAARPDPVIEGIPGRGLLVHVDERFSWSVRSRFQLRLQHVDRDAREPSPFTLEQAAQVSTARLWFGGHALQPELTWLLQLAIAPRDFRDGTVSPIFDAFIDYRLPKNFSVRVGQFFVAFDRLRTVREWALQMTERPLAVGELTLDRDVGIQFSADRFGGDRSPLAWRIGLFGGGGPNAVGSRRPGMLAVARVELRPLGEIDDDIEGDLLRRDDLRLAVGVAAARHWNAHRVRATTGAVLTGDVDFTHAAADLVVKWRGLAVQGEWLRRFADRPITDVDPARDDLRPDPVRSGWGWVAQASWIASVPVEWVVRVSEVRGDASADPAWIEVLDRAGRELGVGTNWYVNGHRFKVQCDGLARVHPATWEIDSYAIRLQVDATF